MISRLLSDAGMLGRLGRDLPPFLRTPLTVEEARTIVRRRQQEREARFLRMTREAVYGHGRSPYRRLLRRAGCEYGDLERLVRDEGLEGALERLASDGVYVTFDEFKGRAVAARGGDRWLFSEADFDNPHLLPHYEIRSGGTRGPATTVKVALAYVAEMAASTALALDAHALARHDHIVWLAAGVMPTLIYAKLARPPLAWMVQVPIPAVVRAGGWYLALLGRLASVRLPTPAFLDLREPEALARRLAALRRDGHRVCVTTYASSAVRTAAAAREHGLDLDGVCCITLGEPFTAGKQRIVAASGARALVRYAFTEAGIIGYGCGEPRGPDDLHAFTDCYGLIRRRRPVGTVGLEVDAYLFTSLLPSAPKILLNVESGDYGSLGRRPCGCRLGAAGLDTHVSEIRSFEKLSGEGMTYVQTDLLKVLEEVLPARFGGTPSDYQVLEEEEQGILRLSLIVSPGVGAIDEASVREVFLQALAGDGALERTRTRIWERAGTIAVRRAWPKATGAGKILPFQLER